MMPNEYIQLFRLVISVFAGIIIGIERKLRMKEAGPRTHAIVAGGACLMMLISKYGFSDTESADTSRMAAQIVSGVGFLGAGMILYTREVLHGLTTAAGIWTTAGIGMAIGAGMYILSAGATVLVVCIQFVLHLNIKIFRGKRYCV